MIQPIVHDVVVIGAGVSGLAAANRLHAHGGDVVVVEAHSKIGGRVQSIPGFVSWDVTSLGAEFIHGRGKLFSLLADMGTTIRETFSWCLGDAPWPEGPVGDGGVGYVWLGKSKTLLEHDNSHPGFMSLKDIVDRMYENNIQLDKNQSMEEFLRGMGFNEEMLSLADGGLANTLCASLSEVSMAEVLEMMQVWEKRGGEGDFRPDGTLTQLVEVLSQPLTDIRCNWVVSKIDYADTFVVVTSKSGETVRARRAIVTVPVTVLKDGDITFSPPLSKEKQDALSHMRMNPATKVILRFRDRFWPEKMHGAICANSFIPEIWADGPERIGYVCAGAAKPPSSTQGEHIICGFATSEFSRTLHGMTESQITRQFLDQLNQMFGTPANPTPASDMHDGGCLVFHWADMPFIRGGYSTVSKGCTSDARKVMAASVDGKLYFAGEGYNDNGLTCDGALESGKTTAEEIIKASKGSKGMCMHGYVFFGVLGVAAAAAAIAVLRRRQD